MTQDESSAKQQSPSDSTLVPQPDLQSILHEYQDRFPELLLDGLLPERNTAHTIPTESGVPPLKPIYRLSLAENAEVQRQATEGIRRGLIEPSSAPYGALVLFVKKKDGSLRLCMDCRALNNMTVKNKYSLPRIDDLLEQLHAAAVLSCLDLQSGHHLIRLIDEDMPKTAFITPLGHYHVQSPHPSGLTNATFQASMNNIQRAYWQVCVGLP